MQKAGWYFVCTMQDAGAPVLATARAAELFLRQPKPYGAGLLRHEARQHMKDHKAGKSPAIGGATGFYQWEAASPSAPQQDAGYPYPKGYARPEA